MSHTPLLTIEGLSVYYPSPGGPNPVVRDVSMSIAKGETLALVGESGSGKSTIAMAIMGLLSDGAQIGSGSVHFEARNLLKLAAHEQRALRGRRMSIVFQDPFTSLNPALTIGQQIADSLVYVEGIARPKANSRVTEALGEVGLPDPASIVGAYPHQLSGGMQQRALIAGALICHPDLLLLDEPTTALDVSVEAQILDLLEMLRARRRLTMLFITHNMGVVARIADRVCVLYAGQIVEDGPKEGILRAPAHPYTKGLLASMPKLSSVDRSSRLPSIPGRLPESLYVPNGCIFEPRCPISEATCRTNAQVMHAVDAGHSARCWKLNALTAAQIFGLPKPGIGDDLRPGASPLLRVEQLTKIYRGSRTKTAWRRIGGIVPWPKVLVREVLALDHLSIEIGRGQVVGVVGESGSGKSTLGRAILRLISVDGGSIQFDGVDISRMSKFELRGFRKRAQIVFQNPHSSLNPRRRVGATIERAVTLFSDTPPAERRSQVDVLLERVGLPPAFYDRYPHQLSGGEKQRVGIARALAPKPDLLVCDEPVSALDVSVQATVLNLLADLRAELGLSYLFISHDLSVVANLSDRIVVMFAGRICEEGTTAEVLHPPYHPYTEALLSAAPGIHFVDGRAHRGAGELLPPDGRAGCPFHTRCARKLGAICENIPPPMADVGRGHKIACHIPAGDLVKMQARILDTRSGMVQPETIRVSDVN